MPPVIFSQGLTVHSGEIYLITSQENREIVTSQTLNWHEKVVRMAKQ